MNVSMMKRLAPARPTEVFDAYWRFAAERQKIFFRRVRGVPEQAWTSDPILSAYKFTNAYRASDRVSQYLIRNVIYRGSDDLEEVFFRTILFKLFNRIETWQLLEQTFGEVSFAGYSFKHYDRVLRKAKASGQRIYSGAYIMPSGNRSFGHDAKHRNNLSLLESMMADELPLRLAAARSMQDAFEMLRAYPTLGDFLAYQYVTDLNYGPLLNFSEMSFVVPGPGCLSGLKKCFSSFGGLTGQNLIRHMADTQEENFRRLGLEFENLWGRPLQLIDCQNLFCEVDKYARVAYPEIEGVANRIRIKQQFRYNPESIPYWYPPKWGINEKIGEQT
jgi:hypothetical protein